MVGDGVPFDWRRILVNGLIGSVIGLVLLLVVVTAAEVPPAQPGAEAAGYVRLFSPPNSPFEVLLVHGDGQAYGALAQDPSLSHKEMFREGPTQAAYFAQRPVLFYSVWTMSFGRSSWLEPAYIAVMALSSGLLAAAATALVQARGRQQNDRLALLVLGLPGAVGGLSWLGPELLGLGFATAGLALWKRGPSTRPVAALCFVLGGLTRETMLLVPFVVGLNELMRRRLRLRDAAILILPPVLYLGWALLIDARFGIGMGQAGRRSDLAAPFKGIAISMGLWGIVDVVVLAVILGLGIFAISRERTSPESWLVVVYLAVGTVLSDKATASWQDFGRILLPSTAFALLIVLPVAGAVVAPSSTRKTDDRRRPARPADRA